VGIFWLMAGKMILETTILSKAEDYGAFKVHPADHYSVWEKLQRGGVVPADMEYEESPRGRVMYDTKTRRFRLLADRCILKDKGIVSNIVTTMTLTKQNMDMGADSHYRCFACLSGAREDSL